MEEKINIKNENVRVKASDLLRKFKSREDRFNFMRELSKLYFNFLDLFLPKEVGFDTNYFLQVLSGQKKVKIFLYNI